MNRLSLNINIKKTIHNIKSALNILTFTGGFVGVSAGCLFGNRSIVIHMQRRWYDEQEFPHTHHHIVTRFTQFNPLYAGMAGVLLFPSLLVFSPFILIDYYGNLCAIDRVVDAFQKKYTVRFNSYGQYGPNDEPYYAPHDIYITVINK
jgi:hypothetical protein